MDYYHICCAERANKLMWILKPQFSTSQTNIDTAHQLTVDANSKSERDIAYRISRIAMKCLTFENSYLMDLLFNISGYNNIKYQHNTKTIALKFNKEFSFHIVVTWPRLDYALPNNFHHLWLGYFSFSEFVCCSYALLDSDLLKNKHVLLPLMLLFLSHDSNKNQIDLIRYWSLEANSTLIFDVFIQCVHNIDNLESPVPNVTFDCKTFWIVEHNISA